MRKIIFIIPYPLKCAPSQRFRFEQYLPLLTARGFSLQFEPFVSEANYPVLYLPNGFGKKILVLLKGIVRRLSLLFAVRNATYIFIHREALPFGPPVVEWIIGRVLGKKIIYDFDDAIWLTDKHESYVEKLLRWRSKVAHICRWSYRISCGNEYLAQYARQFNSRVVVNPTTIDTENLHHPAKVKHVKDPGQVVIGWTGSHSTLKYLEHLLPVLQQLEQEHPQVAFLVIANRNPELPLQRCSFVPWQKETEAHDLARMDIGIMPLPDDAWTRGKCGFKALQYMAMEIPCVASPVGVNTTIIQHGVNGMLAQTAEEWKHCLSLLITRPDLRTQLGRAGRQTVVNRYSVQSNAALFLSLFDD